MEPSASSSSLMSEQSNDHNVDNVDAVNLVDLCQSLLTEQRVIFDQFIAAQVKVSVRDH